MGEQRWVAVVDRELMLALVDASFDEAPTSRFWGKVDRRCTDTDTCWVWTGALSGEGYGNFSITLNGRERTVRARPFDQASRERTTVTCACEVTVQWSTAKKSAAGTPWQAEPGYAYKDRVIGGVVKTAREQAEEYAKDHWRDTYLTTRDMVVINGRELTSLWRFVHDDPAPESPDKENTDDV